MLIFVDSAPSSILPKYDIPTQESLHTGLPIETASSSNLSVEFDEAQTLLPSFPGDPLGAMINVSDNIDWVCTLPKTTFAASKY